jgi:proline dehydrogenase
MDKQKVVNLLKGNRLGRLAIQLAGERYLAGHSIAAGLEEVRRYGTLGRKSTIDILGEAAETPAQAERYFNGYKSVILGIGDRSDIVSISLKPSAICVFKNDAFHEQTPFIPRLESLVELAAEHKINVTLDMEDHVLTDATIDAAKYLWGEGYENFGTVLQSRLFRTQHDILDIYAGKYRVTPEHMRIREVIGIYPEPATIATTDKAVMKQWMVRDIELLIDAGAFIEVGTHDPHVVDTVVGILTRRNVPKDRVEFQFLRGVPIAEDIEKGLLDLGYTVRYYMPIELKKGDSIPYMGRRLLESPQVIQYGFNNIIDGLKRNILLK